MLSFRFLHSLVMERILKVCIRMLGEILIMFLWRPWLFNFVNPLAKLTNRDLY